MRGEKGLTLLELIIALGLSSMVLVAMMAVLTMGVRYQVSTAHGANAQGQALLALGALRTSVSQATEIYSPAPNGAADSLSGCTNYDSAKGAGAAGLLDGGANQAFYFCVAGNSMYYYQAAGSPAACPMPAPTCGVGATMVVANDVYHAPTAGTFFARPPGSRGVVQIAYRVDSGTATDVVDTAVAYEASR